MVCYWKKALLVLTAAVLLLASIHTTKAQAYVGVRSVKISTSGTITIVVKQSGGEQVSNVKASANAGHGWSGGWASPGNGWEWQRPTSARSKKGAIVTIQYQLISTWKWHTPVTIKVRSS